LGNFVALRAGQAKAIASSEVTQYRHANPYTTSVPDVSSRAYRAFWFEMGDTLWLTDT
jgi:hypothetical protein